MAIQLNPVFAKLVKPELCDKMIEFGNTAVTMFAKSDTAIAIASCTTNRTTNFESVLDR